MGKLKDFIRYRRALSFAKLKHKGQMRKEGTPYITHPIAVALMLKKAGYGVDYQIAGLFHDLLEDTDATEQEILERSDEQVLKVVKLLTKRKGYVMADYVNGIKGNEMAFAVKKYDRLNNILTAKKAGLDFCRQYIAETEEWYYDFSDEIVKATEELKKYVIEDGEKKGLADAEKK